MMNGNVRILSFSIITDEASASRQIKRSSDAGEEDDACCGFAACVYDAAYYVSLPLSPIFRLDVELYNLKKKRYSLVFLSEGRVASLFSSLSFSLFFFMIVDPSPPL